MRRLHVDLAELEVAFESGSGLENYYLDTETGEVVMVTDEEHSELEKLYEHVYDETGEEHVPFDEVLAHSNLPDWQKDAVADAHRVRSGFGDRFIRVEPEDSHEGYRDMEAFIETVGDQRMQNRLRKAIDGRGAFRRFKEVLLDQPPERERWFAFKSARLRERIVDWLRSEDIEPAME
jgi:hypothetical protein